MPEIEECQIFTVTRSSLQKLTQAPTDVSTWRHSLHSFHHRMSGDQGVTPDGGHRGNARSRMCLHVTQHPAARARAADSQGPRLLTCNPSQWAVSPCPEQSVQSYFKLCLGVSWLLVHGASFITTNQISMLSYC